MDGIPSFRNHPRDVRPIIEQTLAPLEDDNQTHDFTAVQNFILPVLKPLSYFAKVRAQVEAAGLSWSQAGPPCGEFLGDVAISFVEDRPGSQTRRLIVRQDFDRWSVSPDPIMELATRNLSARPWKLSPAHLSDQASALAIQADVCDSPYNAARLLCAPVLDELVARVQDDLVIGIPTEDTLLAIPASHREAFQALRTETAARFQREPNRLTRDLIGFRRVGRKLQLLTRSGDLPY